jgi:hypothetical protein
VRIDYQEAESYYREHIADFYLPPRLTFLMVTGSAKELVAKAVQQYFQGMKPETMATKFRGVEARLLKMREDRIPGPWRESLVNLKAGQAGPLLQADSGYQQFVLVEKTQGKTLEPSQAFRWFRACFWRKKLAQAFESRLPRPWPGPTSSQRAEPEATSDELAEQPRALRRPRAPIPGRVPRSLSARPRATPTGPSTSSPRSRSDRAPRAARPSLRSRSGRAPAAAHRAMARVA